MMIQSVNCELWHKKPGFLSEQFLRKVFCQGCTSSRKGGCAVENFDSSTPSLSIYYVCDLLPHWLWSWRPACVSTAGDVSAQDFSGGSRSVAGWLHTWGDVSLLWKEMGSWGDVSLYSIFCGKKVHLIYSREIIIFVSKSEIEWANSCLKNEKKYSSQSSHSRLKTQDWKKNSRIESQNRHLPREKRPTISNWEKAICDTNECVKLPVCMKTSLG